jgi:D-beta-D-heptose 7-phosphate kinase/D-beta-D-heptose 1-phosphate adenosyltransferase
MFYDFDFDFNFEFTVLVVGDVMLDTYHHCETFRKAPEADIPVYNVKKTKNKLGGAANVAKNLNNLGCNALLVSVIGTDNTGRELKEILHKSKIRSTLYPNTSRKTTNKIRILHENKLVNRHDIEDTSDIDNNYETSIFGYITSCPNIDAIVISDYAKGVITEKLCQNIIEYANTKHIRTFVDPKVKNIHKYRNCFLFKPNWNEARQMTGLHSEIWTPKNTDIDLCFSFLKEEINSQHTIITCGDAGIYFDNKKNRICLTTDIPVVDVTGSGDVVLAVLVYSFLMKNSTHMSCYLANHIATKGVQTVGNYSVSSKIISETTRIYNDIHGNKYDNDGTTTNKIIKDTDIIKIHNISLMNDVVFTNGCFDIIHSAHIKLLKYAKSLGKILVVGLNSDASIRRFKGTHRPINNETERCELLANLGMVDYIIVFDADTPYSILSDLRPKILVKGGDYEKEQIIGREFAQQVEIFNYIANTSTTNTIQKIKDLNY